MLGPKPPAVLETYGISILCRDLRHFAAQAQVVPLGSERDRHAATEEDEFEDITILYMSSGLVTLHSKARKRTLARFSKKNSYGLSP